MTRSPARRTVFIGTAMVAALIWPLVAAVQRGRPVARRARRATQRVPGAAVRILVVGDSSGVGVGASAPGRTVSGRLAAAHPEWTVGNLARNGSRTSDVAVLLRRLARRVALPSCPRYHAILIHTGGNDALRFTSERRLRATLTDALRSARQLARHTVVVMGGNLALAPAFAPPWSYLFGWRGRRVRALLREVTMETGASFVDLYRLGEEDPTVGDAARYFAPDGLHPSDANYALWFEAIEAALPGR